MYLLDSAIFTFKKITRTPSSKTSSSSQISVCACHVVEYYFPPFICQKLPLSASWQEQEGGVITSYLCIIFYHQMRAIIRTEINRGTQKWQKNRFFPQEMF